jgi:hypothetical protein
MKPNLFWGYKKEFKGIEALDIPNKAIIVMYLLIASLNQIKHFMSLFLWPSIGHILLWTFYSKSDFSGGYSHAPDDLTYGVDMKHIRWCGILQVILVQCSYLPVCIIELSLLIFTLTVENCSCILSSGDFGNCNQGSKYWGQSNCWFLYI